METIINIGASLIYLSLFIGALFSSYFFYMSVNGELRKIYIRKYLAVALFFLGLTIAAYFEHPIGLVAKLSPFAVPFLWYKIMMIRYLISVQENTLPKR